MRHTVVGALLGCLFAFGVIASCGGAGGTFESRLGRVEGQLTAALAQLESLQAKLDGLLAPDGQVAFAHAAGDSDTVDGLHGSQLAEFGTFEPSISPSYGVIATQPTFSYQRIGSRVQVSGSFTVDSVDERVVTADITNLPHRSGLFGNSTDVTGTCVAVLEFFGTPVAMTDSSVSAWVNVNEPTVRAEVYGADYITTAVVTVEFSYDVFSN